jgi:hypothetical protein
MGFCIPLSDTGYPRRMPIVSRGDDEDDESTAAAGAPPAFDIDFDPNDPDQVKVHYNLTGWSLDQRSELAETLAERGVPHVWVGDELVVPEQIEPDVDVLFDELEREIGPFPVPLLDADDDEEPVAITQFELDEWPTADVELLQKSLNEAEIPHRWERRTLLVASDAEHTVDELLDAIEAGEVASLDESAEAPDGALHELYVNADRLARDPVDGSARSSLRALVPQLAPSAPPFGLAIRAWGLIVDRAITLVATFDDDSSPPAISAAADELRSVCRPYV